MPACLGLNLGSGSSLGLFPTLQSGGKVVSPPRMGVRVKGEHAYEVEDSPRTSHAVNARAAG